VGAFGDKFRKEREKKGISLDDVSNVTKIGSRMLQAIEEEQFDRLPGGVFNKGFIRAYAKHLGLNDEEAVADYLACLRQAQIEAHEAWEPARPTQPRLTPPKKRPQAANNKPAAKGETETQVEELPELHLPRAEDVRPPRKEHLRGDDGGIPWRILVAAAVVIVLATVLWIRHSRNKHSDPAAASPANSAPVTQSAPAPVAASTPVPDTASPTSLPAANVASSSHPSAPGTQPRPSTQPRMPAHSPAHAAAQPAANTAPNSETEPSAAPATDQPPANPAATLILVIRASENSWISIIADGQTVSQETLIAPAHTSFHATREIVAKVGNAAGVTFLWNGTEIPAQGAEAEVKTFVFDSAGMRTSPPASSSEPVR